MGNLFIVSVSKRYFLFIFLILHSFVDEFEYLLHVFKNAATCGLQRYYAVVEFHNKGLWNLFFYVLFNTICSTSYLLAVTLASYGVDLWSKIKFQVGPNL